LRRAVTYRPVPEAGGNFRKIFAKSKFAKSFARFSQNHNLRKFPFKILRFFFDDFTTGPNFAKVFPATVALSPISIFFLSFYFNSPKEKIFQKTPKNAKNLTKLLKLRCANFLKEQFYDFFPDFPAKRLPWKALKLRLAGLALKNRFLSRLSKNETAVENIGKS